MGAGLRPSLQPSPIRSQLRFMQLSPCLYQAPLPGGQGTCDHLHRINTEDGNLSLIVRVEVSNVMW